MADLTDPRRHDPERFCYAMHAVNPRWASLFRQSFDQKTYDSAQDLNLLEQPERISEKKQIFCSVISPDHMDTFGRSFFILGFPMESVQGTFVRDRRSEFNLEAAPGATMTPAQMLENTSPRTHNELVLSGRGVQIEALGIKIVHCDNGSSDEPLEADTVRALAKRMRVPCLEFHVHSAIQDGPVLVSRDTAGRASGITMNRNGWHYVLQRVAPDQYLYYKNTSDLDNETPPVSEVQSLLPDIAPALSDVPGGTHLLAVLDGHLAGKDLPEVRFL